MPPFIVARTELLISALWRKLFNHGSSKRDAPRRLRVSGIAQSVSIGRDEIGVPHIYAGSEGDLAFGLGFAMAQDRLWQMEMLRRLAGGRLAELVGDRPIGGAGPHIPGATALALDQHYRSLRMYPVGRIERAQVSDRGRAAIEGFAAGVNAWIARCRPREVPPEFVLAGIRPDPWGPEDSFAVGKLIGWFLSLAFPVKPILARLAGNSMLRRLLPPDMAGGRCILGNVAPSSPSRLDLLAREALGLAGQGSNSWVLSGRLTASGRPLLCNDPHLLFGLPPLWYPVALYGPEYRVIGATMPTIPAVLVGRNDHLAWGFTAVMADDGDYYRETLDSSGSAYLRNGTWHALEIVEEEFRVRGHRVPVRHALSYVRHGGVLCPLLPRGGDVPPTSFRWVGLEAWRGLEAFLGMNRARDLSQFEAALQDFAVPAQNVLVADRQGTIAYYCAGKFPRRLPRADTEVILDGGSESDAWDGYLTWMEQPKRVDPPEGFLASANNRVASELPSTLASGFWEPPYRAARIADLLAQTSVATVEDMAEMQTDILSLQAAGILRCLIEPVYRELSDRDARRAASLLLEWDCRMEADSAAAALYHLLYQQLLQRCFRPIMELQAPGLFAQYLSTLHVAVPAVDSALLTLGEACFPRGVRVTVEEALQAAWRQATAQMGPEPAAWRWGALHRLTLFHGFGHLGGRMAKALAWLLKLNRGPYPRPGDGMTVNLGAFPLGRPFEVMVGPTYRQIVDLGNPDGSQWIVAGGVSGDPRSPHYADQVEPWRHGEYRSMRFRSYEEARTGLTFCLEPDRNVRRET
jgi:penicillin amidase